MNAQGNVGMINTVGGAIGPAQVMNQEAMRQQSDEEQKIRLNTYIYDYLLKMEKFDLARSFQKTCQIKIKQSTSPGRGAVNGVDDAMDADSKDALMKKPADLPIPEVPSYSDKGNCFLYDWWCQFWDVYGARTNRQTRVTPVTMDYINHNLAQSKTRQQLQNHMLQLNDPNMIRMRQYGGNMMMQPNGMMTTEMTKRAMQNNRNATPQQLQQMQASKMGQNLMQRDGSNMEMGGQRSNTPSSMENAPSPSKRPRLDGGGGFNAQTIGPAGRGQPMSGPQMNSLSAAAGANGGMLLQNGVPDLQQQQIGFAAQTPNMQQKIEVYPGQLAQQYRANMNNFTKAMSANLSQSNQMPGPGIDGRVEFSIAGQRMSAGGGGGGGPTTGNHALEDYQMQLMLLEQQNKKRLLMARQEQDHMVQPHPGSAANAQFVAPNMSPSQSRTGGPSPNPSDQLKRVAGTPKMGQGVPGSPMTDMPNRGSPTPYDQAQMPQTGMHPQMYAPMGGGRPPSSHPTGAFAMANMSPQQIDAIRRTNGVSMLPNGQPFPQGGPQMMPQNMQNPQQQPPQMGTPQQRSNPMPPPPAPVSQEQSQRAQPSSPSQPNQAPPTPSQATKSAPKKKESKQATSKKNQPKKPGTTGATPAAADGEPPTPSPISQFNTSSFSKQQNGNNASNNQQQQPPSANANQPQAGPGQQPQAPTAAAQSAPVAQPQPIEFDASGPPNFTIDFSDGMASDFNLDFATGLDTSDVLDNFDFDSLLNTDGGLPFGE